MAAVPSVTSYVEIMRFLRTFLADYELEVYSFKVGWYNDYVDKINKDFYKPNCPKHTIGFIILNTPYFFDKVLKSFVQKYADEHGIDSLNTLEPFEECMKYIVSEIKQGLSPTDLEYFSPNEPVNETDKYFGVQAAGHVSGGVRYYRKEDVVPPHWPQYTTIHGVSMHPRYGGWFAFRGALIFPGLTYSGLLRVEPEDVVPTRDLKIELLEKANYFDQGWEDVIDVERRYSAEQRRFCDFRTPREDKVEMMRSWVN